MAYPGLSKVHPELQTYRSYLQLLDECVQLPHLLVGCDHSDSLLLSPIVLGNHFNEGLHIFFSLVKDCVSRVCSIIEAMVIASLSLTSTISNQLEAGQSLLVHTLMLAVSGGFTFS